MIKFQVKKRFTDKVQFTAEIDCSEDTPRSIKLGLSVKWAIQNKAHLQSANLGGADLRSANLRGADLRGADLQSADLQHANLGGANLRGSNLWGADLQSANLRGADLRSANLRGAKHIMSFGPIGVERRFGSISIKNNKPLVHLGCFTGTEKKALEAIKEKYGTRSSYASVVRAMCAECRTLIKSLPKESE